MSKITLYHGTAKENLGPILAEGILHKWEGVYLTDSAESAARWVGIRAMATGCDSVVVFEVSVSDKKLSPGMDHSPMIHKLFGVGESIIHDGNIKSNQIKNVYEFKIGKP